MARAGWRMTAAALTILFASGAGASRAVGRAPKLVVVVVVDQMRADYLTRFDALFTGGFRRLLDEGAVFTARHGHALTETAPGHATIATGMHPAHHGIFDNEGYEQAARRHVHACEDQTSALPGQGGAPTCSPCRMRASTVGDWLKAASPRSRVYAVALKRRASVFLGGERADTAWWFWTRPGFFVTSAYYRLRELPWVDRFNRSGTVQDLAREPWERSVPEDDCRVARPDAFVADNDGVHTTFPYYASEGGREVTAADADRLLYTPFGDELTLRFAEELVARESLGTQSTPDLLLVSLSAADGVGHTFGPLSPEVEDYYLRLDQTLGNFLDALDRRVGRRDYAFVLTSDHGVALLPEEAASRGIDAHRVTHKDFQPRVRAAIDRAAERLGVSKQLLVLAEFEGAYLQYGQADAAGITRQRVREVVAEELRGLDFVADAYTRDEIEDGATPDRPYLTAYRNSFVLMSSPDVMVRYRRNWLVDCGEHGTRHRTPYEYDTDVPLVFLGPGIAPGVRRGFVPAVDIAPTVAEILGVTPPAGLDGESVRGRLRDGSGDTPPTPGERR